MLQKLGAKAKALPVVALLLLAAACNREPAQNSQQKFSAPSLAQTGAPQPRVYPYSVVPGGIHSVRDFSSKPDAVARKHYQGLQATGVVANPRASLWYVSYRKNGTVYWTRKQLAIPAGEKLVQLTGSDKILYARTRCGNLLSTAPQSPTLPPADEKNIVAEADHIVPVGTAPALIAPAVVPADLKAAIDLPVPAAGLASDPKATMAQSGLGNSAPFGGLGGGGGGVGGGSSSGGGSGSSGSSSGTSASGNTGSGSSSSGNSGSTSSSSGHPGGSRTISGSSGGSNTGQSSNTIAAGGDPSGNPSNNNPTTVSNPTPTPGTTNTPARLDEVVPVPEPGATGLFLSGVAAAIMIWRRRGWTQR